MESIATDTSDIERMYVLMYISCMISMVNTQMNTMVTHVNKVSIDVVRSLHARDEAETTSTGVN